MEKKNIQIKTFCLLLEEVIIENKKKLVSIYWRLPGC